MAALRRAPSPSLFLPRPDQSTWWSAHNGDKAILNGIRSAWPWRTGSVINHSLFWNTTGCWCRLEVQMGICFYGALSRFTADPWRLGYDPWYKTLLYVCLLKHQDHGSLHQASTGFNVISFCGVFFPPPSSLSPSGMWNNWIQHS